MRDTRRDKAYFDEFIEEEYEGIADFEQSIKDGEIEPDRIAYIQDEILMIKTGVLIAKYSRGDDIADIRAELVGMTDDFFKWWDADAYTDNIRFASMAYLFGADENVLEKLHRSLSEKSNGKTFDCLIDFILTGSSGSGKLAWEKSYKPLADAIKTNSAEPLKTYLGRWYNSHRETGWHDTHKIDDDALYYGYWCFEAAAVAKRLGLDDTLIRDNKYYPKDLVK